MAKEKRTKLDRGDAERAAKEATECDEYDPAVYAAESEAYAEFQREVIAEFQELLRVYKVEWSDDEASRYLQKQQLALARVAFGNAPLDGDKRGISEALQEVARLAVLEAAALNARNVQRSVTRRETRTEDNDDILAALRAEVAKRGGNPLRGDMKRIYPDVARAITKKRRKEGRGNVSPRTVQRVWLKETKL